MDVVLEAKELCKSFGAVKANDRISVKLHRGEIMAILGENGSGKTTLIQMLGGLYYPDSGDIFRGGKKVSIRSPKDADALGIGLVHQHFMLVPTMSAVENVEIALPDKDYKNKDEVRERIKTLADQYGFQMDPDKKVGEMSVAEKQTTEIIKALVKGADILILDEPTAVLTPKESRSLFRVLKKMKKDGKSIVLITHKLAEVLAISDTVYIMRKGKHIDTLRTADTDEQELTCKMVGKEVSLQIAHTVGNTDKKVLAVKDISCADAGGAEALDHVSFNLYSGEILGVAGISGSGQKELCECIAGIRDVDDGSIQYYGENGSLELANKGPAWRSRKNINFGFVPEDRLGMGLIASSDITDNMMLRNYKRSAGFFLDRKKSRAAAQRLTRMLQISLPGKHTPVRQLSGGNVQKVLLGREIEEGSDVLIAAYPVRGLDIHASYLIYHLLDEERKKGKAIIFVGEDLDVLMEISDRILVLADGKVSGIEDANTTTKDRIGALMASGSQVANAQTASGR